MFDKLEAELAKALMSLPATKGFEIGSGFTGLVPSLITMDNLLLRTLSFLLFMAAGSLMVGSEHNDEFYIDDNGSVRTRTNRSGGVQVRTWLVSCQVAVAAMAGRIKLCLCLAGRDFKRRDDCFEGCF